MKFTLRKVLSVVLFLALSYMIVIFAYLHRKNPPRNDCSPFRLIFLRFFKVGSTSVVEYFRPEKERFLEWAVAENVSIGCGGLPFEHHVLDSFIKLGLNMENTCMKRSCRSAHAQYAVVLRNPLDRFISSLYYFTGAQTKYYYFRNAGMGINRIYEKMLTTPHLVEEHEAVRFVLYMKAKYNIFFPRLTLAPYEQVLGRVSKFPYQPNTEHVKRNAEKNLRAFTAVGVMEHMPSYFVLLSKIFPNIPLEGACKQHDDHEEARQKSAVAIQRNGRPPTHQLFNQSVLDIFAAEMTTDFYLWDVAKELHEQQLASYGLTIQSAYAIYNSTCNGKNHKVLANVE